MALKILVNRVGGRSEAVQRVLAMPDTLRNIRRELKRYALRVEVETNQAHSPP